MKRLNYAFTFVVAVVAMGVFSLAPSALQAQYCTGPINGADDEWITNVSFADVDNSTAFGVSTANQINATATVTPGENVDFTVEVTTDTDFGFTEAIVIYFDFDNDFTFETSLDLGEQNVTTTGAVFDASTAPGGSNTVTMPSTPGTYRMRVVLDFAGPVPGPCDDDNPFTTFKDSEDYEIVVQSGGGPTCDDGIQNGDETGVDCGGSCPPCDDVATCDDGIQNGDETGVDCGGSCPPCEEVCDGEEFTVNINFDNFASETSWEITNINGSEAASNAYSFTDSGGSTSEEYCLEAGCYEFTIFDSFGDGICCGFGLGDYSLEGPGGEVASGGNFGSSETTFFCTDPGPDCVPPTATATAVPYCDNGVFMVQVTLSDLGSANTVTIGNSGGVPALQNVFFPRTYFVGPFDLDERVDIYVYDTENSACITILENLMGDCASLVEAPTSSGNLAFGDVSVFPNPTTGVVNVNLTAITGENAHIRVMNTVGQLIEQRQVNGIESATERFDLSGQQSGMYFIHVQVEGGDTYVKRVVLGDLRP